MEALPLGKRLARAVLILLGIPIQHGLVKLQTHAAAVRRYDALRVVEKVVRVDDADVDLAVLTSIIATVVASVAVRSSFGGASPSDARPDLPDGAQVVEEAAQLRVAGLGGHEGVEAGHAVERRDGAAEVGRHAGARVADQEREVELGQQFRRDDGWVGGLSGGGGVGGGAGVRVDAVGGDISVDDDGGCRGFRPRVVGTDAAFDPPQGGGDAGWLFVRRDDVVSDVLDEETLALDSG